jgi:spermidine synthase
MRLAEDFPAKSTSFLLGMLSLAAETLWVRAFSFLGRSTPIAVSTILGTYLLGIAFGAVLGARFCRTMDKDRLIEIIIISLLAGSIVILSSPFALVAAGEIAASDSFNSIIVQGIIALCLAFLPALIFSVCFPVCHHLGTKTDNIGKGMSRVYAANIAGSVAGPLVMNFAILQFATTQLAFAILGITGAATGFVLLYFVRPLKGLRIASTICLALGVASVVATMRSDNWLIKSLASSTKLDIARVIETRQGIVVSYKDEKLGDMIYGGNVYDGRANLDPRINSNGLNRILVAAAIRPNPKRVLIVGLSIGSWNYIVTGFPGVEHIDVVEIDPGYLALMHDYPRQEAAINDLRISIYIGDGRKFLRNSPEHVYDLIVMNTSWHWRAYSSLLLSKEFLTLVRDRMAPGGLFMFNTTDSFDALFTAASVFRHAYLYDNFAICADFDWRVAMNDPKSILELLKVSPEGKQSLTNDDVGIARDFLSLARTANVDELAAKAGRPLEIITDRNLLTEYKYGRSIGTNQ